MVELKNKKIKLNLERTLNDSYEIIFGQNLFENIAKDIKNSTNNERKIAIITDSNLKHKTPHPEALTKALRDQKLDSQIFYFKAGEENKTIDSCMNILGEMSNLKYGRNSLVLALGGGVVGDMSGFMAAIFNRGVPYIQIPTTVLAQADSSVGGKTAVDTEHGKNLVGVFNQPDKVYVDVATLSTLEQREYLSGFAEHIKHGIIRDEELFSLLKNNVNKILERDFGILERLSMKSCKIKGNVVEIDPNEKNLRQILNYGHTVGHAIEKLSVDNYENGRNNSYLLHGEAISIGMMVAGKISNILGYMTDVDLQKQYEILTSFRLPTKVPIEILTEDILKVTSTDKKAVNGVARYVLPMQLGNMATFKNGKYSNFVENEVVINAINQNR